jgi:N6-L-threonylcarbamoyladenine synthase
LYHAADAYERLASAKPNLVVAGGVAANQAIRQALRESADARGYRLIYPPMKLCTDNAAMIAWAGYEQFQNAGADELTFEPRARWPLS